VDGYTGAEFQSEPSPDQVCHRRPVPRPALTSIMGLPPRSRLRRSVALENSVFSPGGVSAGLSGRASVLFRFVFFDPLQRASGGSVRLRKGARLAFGPWLGSRSPLAGVAGEAANRFEGGIRALTFGKAVVDAVRESTIGEEATATRNTRRHLIRGCSRNSDTT
jgi:hypothetical protein